MVVLFKTIRLFILCQILAELMLAHQITFYQQIEGIVNSSAAYPVVFVFHVDVQRLYIKMTIQGVNLFQNSISLWRFTQLLLFKVGRKNLPYLIVNSLI